MSLKEAGKEIAVAGLTALLLNPLTLLILLIVGIILIAVGIGIIIYYGLVTAITFFILGTMAVLALHYTKAVNLERQPYIALMPFLLAVFGYIGERIRLFSIQPLWITQTPTTTQNTQLLLILLLVILVTAAVLSRRKG